MSFTVQSRTTPFRVVVALGLLLTAFAVAPARAQSSDLKIAIIDVQKIITESQTGKAALAELESFSKAEQGRLKAQNDEITQLRGRITEGSLSLAQEALAEMQQQLEEKITALRRASEDANRKVEKMQQDTLRGIEAKVMPVIQQMGRDQGYTMILRKFESGLIFAKEEIDITASIIEVLDAANAPGTP